jgi:hypothetical protein
MGKIRDARHAGRSSKPTPVTSGSPSPSAIDLAGIASSHEPIAVRAKSAVA